MREIETLDAFDAWTAEGAEEVAAVQALDLRPRTTALCRIGPTGSLFLGCKMDPLAAGQLVSQGAIVVPDMPGCFSVHRSALYAPEELYDVYDPDVDGSFEASLDSRVYVEYLAAGRDRPESMAVSFARAQHDHSITAALDEMLEGKRVVAIMGGHGLERRDPMYAEVVRVAKRLAETSYVLVSGGGPGAMEATHLGAWLAGRPDRAVDEVLQSGFAARPDGAEPGTEYADGCWLERAWRVRQQFPQVRDVISIGIPTWLYGHEPPTPLATHIAKYFANAIREEGLLAIAQHGVVFAPGSAGTTQEIFQDACQNHYGTAGIRSPMVMMGSHYWTEVRPVWPLLDTVSRDRRYGELVHLVDGVDDVVRCIMDFEPSWYLVSDDVDLALETELRHALHLRGNVVFQHARVERTPDLTADVAAVVALLGVEGTLGDVVPAAAFGDWLVGVLTDNWVDPNAARAATAHLEDAALHRYGDACVLVREDTVSAWTLRLDD